MSINENLLFEEIYKNEKYIRKQLHLLRVSINYNYELIRIAIDIEKQMIIISRPYDCKSYEFTPSSTLIFEYFKLKYS